MIEFRGLYFDFENMIMLNANGREHYLMRLDNMFYVQTSTSNSFAERVGVVNTGTWHYVFNDHMLDRELYQRYEQWIIEEIVLNGMD